MFDALSEKLQATLDDVRQRGTLTETDINAAMREIRLALLEADVNFKVVKSFTNTVKERSLGADVIGQLNPGQQVVKIVHEELVALMGGESEGLTFSSRPPTVILMSGLQGSGKTTAVAKLARWLKEEKGSSVAVAACDVQRPAAVEQLRLVGAQAGATVYDRGTELSAVEVARWALDQAKQDGKDVLIVDTAGRLHVDQALMDELVQIRDAVRPDTVLLTVDAMTGQDAVNVAEQFAAAAGFDGVVMSKLDGDARGGAALSVKAVTGKPILFASTGEKLPDFQAFHPDRMAQRILGMGDVLSLIEQAEKQFDEGDAKDLERKLRRNEFTLEDFLKQMKMIRKMGPLSKVLGMLPGVGAQLKDAQVDDREMDRVEAIILSMTPKERRHPELIKGGRRLRIAKGSGTSVQQVNQLVKNFQQMRKMMKQMSKGGMKGLEGMMGGAGMPGGAAGMGGGGGQPQIGVRGGSRAARRRKK
ncbi:signal recognition particle protein [Patulibacter americanus]|uniref:signal recognition particle protein n=1 Tax=Patulibacter americanus TaxID=588672 RepID=UPI00040BFAD2|nr:signal recognition particle protein [Patulibacter americanus]